MGESPFDADDQSELSGPAPRDDRLLRLRLHHLLVLTAVMAVLLGINGPQGSYGGTSSEPPDFVRIFSIVLGTAHTLLSAVALTALGYGIARYRRGMWLFDQPGHWLLVEISITALIYVLPSIAYRSGLATMMFEMGHVPLIVFLIIAIGRIIFNIYLGVAKCNERRWRTVFFLKALATLIFGLGGILVLFATIYAWRADRKLQTYRDQGHWIGVWLQLALSSLSLFNMAFVVYAIVGMVFR